jgi:hypothetical protein
MDSDEWERIVTEYGEALTALKETVSRARVVVPGQWRMREAITPEFREEVFKREARLDEAREALHRVLGLEPTDAS